MTENADPRLPALREVSEPERSASDAEYAEWLRAELDRLAERGYARIFFPRGTRENYDFVFGPWANQSRMFATDLLDKLKAPLLKLAWGSHLTLLDVGAGCGAGTALLASFFAQPWFGYTIRCEALEPTRQWADLYPVLYRDLAVRTDHLCDVADASYDIVTASHVIEHMARREAPAFIRKLVSVARSFAIVTSPWQEGQPRCPGHEFSVDQDLIAEVEPDSIAIYRSLGWNNPVADASRLQCVAMLFWHK